MFASARRLADRKVQLGTNAVWFQRTHAQLRIAAEDQLQTFAQCRQPGAEPVAGLPQTHAGVEPMNSKSTGCGMIFAS